MKIFTLNDPIVKAIRRDHPALQDRKLIGSGQFSGVFEGSSENTVLKLSIDEASYIFHTDSLLKPLNSPHFAKVTHNFGRVGTFTTSKNVTRTQLSNPIELRVPIYLYEVEKLAKIPQGSVNGRLAKRLAKDWRTQDELSTCSDLRTRAQDVAFHLRDNAYYQHDNKSVMDAIDEIADFMADYDQAFVDIHGANMMQRQDGTFVFSDPVGDLRIYNSHYTFRPVTTLTTEDVKRIREEYIKNKVAWTTPKLTHYTSLAHRNELFNNWKGKSPWI